MGLTGMGFPEGRSKKALVLTGNDVEAAIEWLVPWLRHHFSFGSPRSLPPSLPASCTSM